MDLAYASVPGKKRAILFLSVTGGLALIVLAAWFTLPQSLLKLAVLGALASVGGLSVFAYPRHGFYLGVFYVYAGIAYYTQLPVAAAMTFLVTAAVFVGLLRGDSIQMTDRLFNGSLAVFTVIACQSLLFSWDHSYSLTSLASFAKSILTVFLIAQLIRTGKNLETLAFVVFGAVLTSVLLGVVNVKLGLIKDWMVLSGAFGWQRFGATHVSPNVAALYLVGGLPLGIYAVKRVRPILTKIFLAICVIALLVGLVATFSRQTIFPLSIVLLAVLFREAHSKWVYAVVVLAAVVGLLLVPEYYWYRVSSIGQLLEGDSDDFSLAIRFKAFKAAWHLFLQHPLTGVGLNNFIVRSGPELHVTIGAHNGYLEILSGVGIFGFIAFILMPVSAIRGFVKAFKTPWPEERRWMKDLSYYFLLSAIAVFVAIFFEQSQFYRVYWLPIAAGLVAGRLADQARSPVKKSET